MSLDNALRNLTDVAAALMLKTYHTLSRPARCWVQFGEGQFIRHDSDTDLTVPADSFDPQVLLDLRHRGFRISKVGLVS
jgi:hypothetical protein